MHVENYARAHPNEDLEESKDAAEAGLPSQPDQPLSSGDVAADDAISSLGQDAHGQKREEADAEPAASPKRAKFADAGFSLMESTFLVDDSETKQVPKTPKLSEDAAKRQMESGDKHRSVFV